MIIQQLQQVDMKIVWNEYLETVIVHLPAVNFREAVVLQNNEKIPFVYLTKGICEFLTYVY